MESLSSKCSADEELFFRASDDSSSVAHKHVPSGAKKQNWQCEARICFWREPTFLSCRFCLLLKFLRKNFCTHQAGAHHNNGSTDAIHCALIERRTERRPPQVANNLQSKQSAWWALIELCEKRCIWCRLSLNLFLIMESAERETNINRETRGASTWDALPNYFRNACANLNTSRWWNKRRKKWFLFRF